MKNIDKNGHQYFTVRLAAILIKNDKTLILQFSSKTSYGRWGLAGGRMDAKELADQAFARELKEELGFTNFTVNGLVDYDVWYEADDYPCLAIAHSIDSNDEIKLSHEHLQYKWISYDEIDSFDFVWPNAARMLKKGFDYHKSHK